MVMQLNWSRLILFIAILFFGCGRRSEFIQLEVAGIDQPQILLNGTWKFSMDPPQGFWKDSVDFSDWADIRVPGECQMQGFAIRHDQPYVYKYRFSVPEDYKEKQVLLNFYGVYSYARLWVNGNEVREHFGGFTKWQSDITPYISPGEEAILTLEIVDHTDDISYGSGYAKHQIGGILRDVSLIALPTQNFEKLYFETDLDEHYENAALKVFYELTRNVPAKIKIELFSKEKRLVKSVEKTLDSKIGVFEIPVKGPDKWDAEHPNLYTVSVAILENGEQTFKTSTKIGFREIVVQGNKLLVNGRQVKLRGACRHDMNPLLGRMTTPEYDKKDVLLAKEANMNFIRTSHYPPSEKFLEYCDQFGLYVEDETAVCFVGSHRTQNYQASGATQNDSAFTSKYLSQLEEMVQNHRNHPSVIIWSIGNENTFGSNFVKSYRWVKDHDSTRPVIYSYPGQVPDSLHIFDIVSMHYPDWKGNLNQYGINTTNFSYQSRPMLFDEWAHVPCYNNFELRADPNVRNFWGQSLDSMWTRTFVSDGGLGGAIWGMIDETFMLPKDLEGFNQWWGILDPNVIPATYRGPCVGYGEWGIVDTWRRKKPEFWEAKKAYSPTKIYEKRIGNFQPGMELKIPVHNRFDHTNFNELKIVWRYGNQTGELENVKLEPHQKGQLVIPSHDWQNGSKLNLYFYQNDTFLIDEYNLELGEKSIVLPECKKGKLQAVVSEDHITLSGRAFTLKVNKKTGLLEDVNVHDEELIQSGPYINLKLPGKRIQYSTIEMQDYAANWQCAAFDFSMNEGGAHIQTDGKYDSISVKFNIHIGDNGVFKFEYEIKHAPMGNTVEEAGLKFIVGDDFQKLAWQRASYFTAYPENHLGRPSGEVDMTVRPIMTYRQKPAQDWAMDSRDFYYFGLNEQLPYTNIVRSMKENIFYYILKTRNSKMAVHADGRQSCRFDKVDGKNILLVDDLWDYNSLLWGNYMKLVPSEKEYKGQVIITVE